MRMNAFIRGFADEMEKASVFGKPLGRIITPAGTRKGFAEQLRKTRKTHGPMTARFELAGMRGGAEAGGRTGSRPGSGPEQILEKSERAAKAGVKMQAFREKAKGRISEKELIQIKKNIGQAKGQL